VTPCIYIYIYSIKYSRLSSSTYSGLSSSR